MWETVRAIREAKYKPKIVLWENVAVTTKYPEYQRYLKKMGELGYTNSFKILNSLDFGIPQTRNRVFIYGKPRNNSRTIIKSFRD